MTLAFDPEEHQYTLDGLRIPSVTRVMAPLVDLSGVDAETLEYSADRGTYVHAATALDDRGTLDYVALDSSLRPYVDAWRRFRSDAGFDPVHIEHMVAAYRYAGTIDRVGLLRGRLAIIDIKTTATLGRHVGVQLAAYRYAYNLGHKLPRERAQRTFAVQLRSDGYSLKEYTATDADDLAAFLAALRLHQWRMKG